MGTVGLQGGTAASCPEPYPAKGCEEGSGRRVPRPVCVLLPKSSFLVRGAGGSALSGRRQGRSPNHLTGSQMCSNWSGCPDPRSPFCLPPHIPLSHLHTALSLSQAARLPAKKALSTSWDTQNPFVTETSWCDECAIRSAHFLLLERRKTTGDRNCHRVLHGFEGAEPL